MSSDFQVLSSEQHVEMLKDAERFRKLARYYIATGEGGDTLDIFRKLVDDMHLGEQTS